MQIEKRKDLSPPNDSLDYQPWDLETWEEIDGTPYRYRESFDHDPSFEDMAGFERRAAAAIERARNDGATSAEQPGNRPATG